MCAIEYQWHLLIYQHVRKLATIHNPVNWIERASPQTSQSFFGIVICGLLFYCYIQMGYKLKEKPE